MAGGRFTTAAAAVGLLLAGCGVGAEAQVLEADAAGQEVHSEGDQRRDQDEDAATDSQAKQAEKRAERGEGRARQAEKRAEAAEAKAAAAEGAEQTSGGADPAVEQLMEDPALQRMALDIGWASVTRAERGDMCTGWGLGREVRELLVEVMVESAEGIIEREVAQDYLDEKCS